MQRIQTRQLISLSAVAAMFAILAAFAVFGSDGRAGVVAAQDAARSAVSSGIPQNWFMNVAGIPGESDDVGYKDWIELSSVSHLIERPGSGASGATRRSGGVDIGDLIVTKQLDATTPKLMEAIATRKVLPEVEIHLTATYAKEGRAPYFMWELKNVQGTSYSVSGSSDNGVPAEQISLNFEEIKVTYVKRDDAGQSGGNVEFEWKVEEGES